MNEEFFRVTSIQHLSTKYTTFSGIPLKPDSYRINSGKYIVSVKCALSCMPVLPANGQQWRVKGLRSIGSVDVGDYSLEQHTYESPEEMECTLPNSGEAFIKFIAAEKEFKGIGEAKARSLWDAFGEKLHEMLRSDMLEHRQHLLNILSDASITSLYEGYAKYKNLTYANKMTSMGIPLSIQQRIFKYHDEQSVKAIIDNPYTLMGFGMSFADVDCVSSKMNMLESDPKRLAAAVEYAIRKQVESGHTYTSHHVIKPIVSKLLGDSGLAAHAFENGYKNAQFILKSETGTYHPTAQLIMESVVAKRLKSTSACNESIGLVYEAMKSAVADLLYTLAEKQLEAVEISLVNPVSCITGGAGTGKTTVLRTVLKAYHALGYEIYAVALSGRAAMRLHESIGFNTMTIARFLREEPVVPSVAGSKHLLVIDEASMIDLPTMYRIVTHIDPSVRIIFSGDPNQLPPIGCGKVLSDLVDSGVIRNTKLDIVKRQDGSTGIPEYSACINRGEIPSLLTAGGITFHETSPDLIVPVCKNLYAMSPDTTQIVGSTKAIVAELNSQCQKLVNPNGNRLQFNLYGDNFFLDLHKGDPILFTKNNYSIGVQNGTLGILTSTECKSDGDTQSFGEVLLDTGDKVLITEEVLDCMELGYAITLHKAQGSQFPRVIVALKPGRIVDRSWLYTAITRAESELHIVGATKDFASIIKTASNSNKRNSYLKNLLLASD